MGLQKGKRKRLSLRKGREGKLGPSGGGVNRQPSERASGNNTCGGTLRGAPVTIAEEGKLTRINGKVHMIKLG